MEIKPGIYKHYKGKEYRVICVAQHTETKTPELFVVYEALYPNEVSQFWVRPLAIFQENIVIDGKRMPGFEFLRDK